MNINLIRLRTVLDGREPEVIKETTNFIEEINNYGGNMKGAAGVPEEMLRKAAQKAVCKINIDSDIRLAITAAIRKHFAQHPEHFDPRQYLAPAREAVKQMVLHKIINVLGSNGKA